MSQTKTAKTIIVTRDVQAPWLEKDEMGDYHNPEGPAQMTLTLPYPLSDADTVALWKAFSTELRTALGYTDEMGNRPNPFSEFKM